MKDYIAYQGEAFQIEFYYDEKGKSQPIDYIANRFQNADAKKLLYLLQTMGDHGQIRNKEKFRHEGDGIYAFKPQPHRFLCFFFEGSKIIITNAFMKKQQKLPDNEKEKAVRCRKDYINRNRKGAYYEKGE